MSTDTPSRYEALPPTPKVERLRERYQQYYCVLAGEAGPELSGPDQAAWLDLVEAEHENFRSAIEWSLATGKADDALRICVALERFWGRRPGEGIRTVDRAISAADESCAERVQAMGLAAWLAVELERPDARDRVDEAVDSARRAGGDGEIARALITKAALERFSGRYVEERAVAEEALVHARASGQPRLIARALSRIGFATRVEEGHASARPFFEEALEIDRRLGDIAMIALDLYFFIFATPPGPERDAAFEEALRLSREVRDQRQLCNVLDARGWSCLYGEGVAPARRAWNDAVDVVRSTVDRRFLSYYLTEAGFAARLSGDFDGARPLLEEAVSLGGSSAAWPLMELVFLELQCGGDVERARELAEKAITAEAGSGQAQGHFAVAAVMLTAGDLDGATRALEEAFAQAVDRGAALPAHSSALRLALLAADRDDFEAAREWVARAPQLEQADGTRLCLAAIALREGDVERASQLYRAELSASRQRYPSRSDGWVLEGLADAASARGDHQRAARLLGAAERAHERYGCVRDAWGFWGIHYLVHDDFEERVARLRSTLGDEAFRRAWDEGGAMSATEVIEVATS